MPKRKVLLAEDDHMLGSLLKFRLERDGYEVVLEYDGKAVKEKLQGEIPDLVISDIMMPYFSGIELVDHLRNILKSDVPIILISAASNDENIVSAFEMGANDFISKPVSPSELLVRVSREIKRHYCT
ncbi:MAG: response regulator transcription factor [Bacteroidota bacterium]